MGQIEEIDKVGEALKNYSSGLISRIDRVSTLIGGKFDKLS
jgi:hypothetical protein